MFELIRMHSAVQSGDSHHFYASNSSSLSYEALSIYKDKIDDQ